MDVDPRDRHGGVTLKDLRASLEFEAAGGRGPDWPAYLESLKAEAREDERLAELKKQRDAERRGSWKR